MSSDINSDLAYDYIRKRILSGEFGPGKHLTARVIAGEIQVSATPVRDALRQLEADGLVTIHARQGARVNAMDLEEFRELCELRLILETQTAGLAAQRRSDRDLREMELALETMRLLTRQLTAGSGGEEVTLLARLAQADVQFHIAILNAAKNNLIRDEILRLHLVNRVIARAASAARSRGTGGGELDTGHLATVLAEHEAILVAIQRGDAAAAETAMERSLQHIINETLRTMARSEREQLTRVLTDGGTSTGSVYTSS